jgi:hypothetical protein
MTTNRRTRELDVDDSVMVMTTATALEDERERENISIVIVQEWDFSNQAILHSYDRCTIIGMIRKNLRSLLLI